MFFCWNYVYSGSLWENDPNWRAYLSVELVQPHKQERCAWAHSKKQPISQAAVPPGNNLSGRCYPNQRTAKDPIFFCFRPDKMGRIWRSFCWKRATVFMASFDDPLVSIPHVSIISSTRREWWGGWLKWSMWLVWLMWLMWHVTEDHIIFEVVCDVDVFVGWSSNPPHPKRFCVGTDEVLL